MTAVTQCPQCGTRFRVVPDQLKLSQGWVRCGKCSEVFNARDALDADEALKSQGGTRPKVGVPTQVSIVLRNLETDGSPRAVGDTVEPEGEPPAPPPWLMKVSSAPIGKVEAAPTVSSEAAGGTPAVAIAPASTSVLALEQAISHWVREVTAEEGNAPVAAQPVAETSSDAVGTDVTPGELQPALVVGSGAELPVSAPVSAEPEAGALSDPPASTMAASGPPLDPAVPDLMPHAPMSAAEPAGTVAPVPDVGFVRQARRKAAWSSAPVRAALWLVVLCASGLLAFQVAVQERNRLAAVSPALKPWLIQLCEHVGCAVGPFEHIEAVEIAGTELLKASDGTYRFDVSLRNRSVVPVALPALELTLTDRSGEPVVRKVLLPEDWSQSLTELPPLTETGLTLTMSLREPDQMRMDGFRAVVFYP